MTAFPHRERNGRAAAFLKMHTRSAQRLNLTACGLDISGKVGGRWPSGYRAPSLTDPATLRVLGSSACSVCLNQIGLSA